jgi:histidine decarboxylase
MPEQEVKKIIKLIESGQHQPDFNDLLSYIDNLAQHKMGYPVSLLTYLGIVDNQSLGIMPGSLANILLNNVGDPFKDSETSLMEVKQYERDLIAILERYYGMAKGEARGYVTTGGTEGNFASLWWTKRYLINSVLDNLIKTDDQIKSLSRLEQELAVELAKIPVKDYEKRCLHFQKILETKEAIAKQRGTAQQLLTPTVFYSKNHTHYSIPKIAEILRLNIKPVQSNDDGSLNMEEFKKELLFHTNANPFSPVIVIANIGTTITGAIDDVLAIKKILDNSKVKPVYSIHLDGALTGFVMPIIKPFGDEIKNYFDDIGVNTLAVSAHKYPGLSQPCGIVLARREFFDKAFEKSERSIEYVGNINDFTITGSRSGLNVLMFYNALHSLGLHKDNSKLTEFVNENIKTANYLASELEKLYGDVAVSHLFHFNVSFPRPSMKIAKKYQLMLVNDRATICVLANINRKLIDEFIADLKNDKEESAMANLITKEKVDYKIQLLTQEYMQSTAELFIKAFCDSEPITRHLAMQYHEYEPFVYQVLKKAVKDKMSMIAVSPDNHVIACSIAEDITDLFKPEPHLYPKMKPIIALLEQLSGRFLANKVFVKGKVAHVWIAMVDPAYRGLNLSTAIDMACGKWCLEKGYEYVYAEFTNEVSEKITRHFAFSQILNYVDYEDFTWGGTQPFLGVPGGAASYIVGIKPGVTSETFEQCYKIIGD